MDVRPTRLHSYLFPDNGSNRPAETQPLGNGATFFRFSPTWVKIPVDVTLPAGQSWVRLTGDQNYEAGIYEGNSGLPSLSRKSNGNFVTGAAIALQLLAPQLHWGDLNCDGVVNFGDIIPFATLLRQPQNPAGGCRRRSHRSVPCTRPSA